MKAYILSTLVCMTARPSATSTLIPAKHSGCPDKANSVLCVYRSLKCLINGGSGRETVNIILHTDRVLKQSTFFDQILIEEAAENGCRDVPVGQQNPC